MYCEIPLLANCSFLQPKRSCEQSGGMSHCRNFQLLMTTIRNSKIGCKSS
ncbi:hypothetical protein MPTK1_5g15030 [Marchantia polymorpha subsp. ruderalis]|uniref:Uncharacterized protein n=2 Tax=Marchantia polymorpha TaxID=3197 RepID=A0AAF6BII4_MARPO|nr:hypothetical protein MARPO_0071s0107 [Marchantia polymorpha]PTQ35504.1 hypothetical protein MARPO_0071s0107 [Marchantia polymorpha]BBN11818.1 hypothetical protein Mp_5g15030 [Marchantia polymorpha subsp. ruderalis]BBN11819.1 hypothetical protein Mp_5g15030 [Marchantia polymorpha subsp. ruderalis]|eukprot:PTQ35503.1 hypothetical protein MARPO_0071s0107 [Marchantia polymorpha]